MIFDNIKKLINGCYLSLSLTVISFLISTLLSIFLTKILISNKKYLIKIVKLYILIYTGTPLLIQFFLIYYGLAEFNFIKNNIFLWYIFSKPFFCAIITLSLNSSAYTTQLFYNIIKNISVNKLNNCLALGLSKKQSLFILAPLFIRKFLSLFFDEIIIIFKSTSLACTITIMEIMGYTQFFYGQTYNFSIFYSSIFIYILINGLISLIMFFLKFFLKKK